MKMAKKERLLKAFSLEIEFFGGWKAIIYGSIPLIYWLIRRFGRGRVGEIVAFCLAYAVAAAVFVWQFFTAERKLAVLDTLDPTEKRQLQPLVLKKESQLVQNVFNTIENKTRLQRDFIGWWRVEQEYKDLLMHGSALARHLPAFA